MPSEKFLKQVAEYYIDKGIDMTDMTFVFPNRRSALFMHKYMKERAVNPVFKPRMISITYFTQMLSNRAPATNTELVFMLYKAYCRILKRHGREHQISDFDKFYFWGTIILNDFNDVDAYLANVAELYKNLKDFKSMRANYLTPEQVEVIKYIWGDDFEVPDEDVFWLHLQKSGGVNDPNVSKFLNLWEIMYELYDEFTKDLSRGSNPIAYAGLQSRLAYKHVNEMSLDDFRGQRYVFVGFNVLSNARMLIFRRLKDLGIADFFWDVASPLLSDDRHLGNCNGRYVLSLARKFKMPDDFELQPIEGKGDIEILSVPSAFGQTKVASAILNDWVKQWRQQGGEGALSADSLVNTAIVLADDSLLMPLLYSISPEIQPINVTMSISYSSTPFAALISSIISMHLRARKSQMTYYYADVIDVLSHQYISMIEPEAAAQIKERILTEHIYTVRAQQLIAEYPQLEFVFALINDDRDIRQVRGYIDGLVSTLRRRLCEVLGADSTKQYYELCILDGYSKAVDDLCGLIETYGITMEEHTFLQMIERTLALTPVTFAGQPLKGLQIMSVMDTRALDFDNIIMLSMNERIFPKRNYNPSFIPASLRAAYNLPTQEQEENSYAYQFYRLISRADHVRLLYDSRTGGVTSGEKSRYLSQLLYLCPDLNIRERAVEFRAESDDVAPITINKTEGVVAELRRFRPGGDLRLSASALKTYISCPLRFYLQYVKRMRSNDEVLEYIDAASYGSVIHKVVQNLYLDHAGVGDGGRRPVVNEFLLTKMINDNIEQRSLLTLNELYYKGRYSRVLSQMPGEGKIISRIIAQYVKRMLESEKALVPFTFIDAEFGEHKTLQWRINDKYTLNFTMSIDRIDAYREASNPDEVVLRFIDYKTGSDALSVVDLDALFSKHDFGGIFQLLLYSHAYKALFNGGADLRIKPVIYKFVSIPTDGISDLKIHRNPINDYLDVDTGEEVTFYERFEQLIDKIFEEDNVYPFCQTADSKECQYCQFASMCGRYPDPN